MADKKSSTSFLNSLVAFAFIGGILLWLALVVTAQGEQRLEQACKPVEFTTNMLHEVTTSVIGRQPTWTLYVQRYLMTGCYYGFSVIMSQSLPGTEESTFGGNTAVEPTVGGIQ
jgi:hypothetical protein